MSKKRGARRCARQSARALKERDCGFSSMEILESLAEATAMPSWAQREWLEAVRIIVPYWQRKQLWPSCFPEAQRDYYRQNHARIRENQRRYYQRHRTERNAHSMAWAKSNHQRVLANRRKWRAVHAEAERARVRAWQSANRNKINSRRRERRADG